MTSHRIVIAICWCACVCVHILKDRVQENGLDCVTVIANKVFSCYVGTVSIVFLMRHTLRCCHVGTVISLADGREASQVARFLVGIVRAAHISLIGSCCTDVTVIRFLQFCNVDTI